VATLTVWRFESADGAEQALRTLEQLQKEDVIDVNDGAIVSWPEGAKRPKTTQMHSLAAGGALGGAFWGMLFGLIFFIPLIGLAVGAAAGALGGALTDVGIDDDFIAQVRKEITPGTSALFLLSSNAVLDKVKPAVEGMHAHLIHTNLSDAEEAKLRDVFSDA
jgi:uncharacterized membrane protein